MCTSVSLAYPLELFLVVETSPVQVVTMPNKQFNVTCIAKAMVEGQEVAIDIIIEWTRIGFTPLSINQIDRTLFTTTNSHNTIYKSNLTTTEANTVNKATYRCTARTASNSTSNSSNTTVIVEGKLHVLTCTDDPYRCIQH